jgi:ribosomal protein S18 acetylase RimI-like enzyme
MYIRTATEADEAEIVRFDHVAREDTDRQQFIRESIETERCSVCVDEHQVIGYGVLEHSFYRQGFVAMLYVHPDHRRRGVGLGLMRWMESECRTAKIWTSTNLSNTAMQSLLAKLDYRLSGFFDNLDPGDPELVYVKFLEPGGV